MVSVIFAQQETNLEANPMSAAPPSQSYISESNAPRSIIYNEVMQNNPAADFTVADYMIRPHLIGSQQFIVANGAGAELYSGTFAMQLSGLGVFANVTHNAGIQRLRVGSNFGEALGAGIIYQINRARVKQEDLDKAASNTTETITKTTSPGTGFGLFGSMGLGALSAYGQVLRETEPGNSVKTEIDYPPGGAGDTTLAFKNNTTSLMLGIMKDSEKEGDHAFGAQLDLSIHKAKTDGMTPPVDSSGLGIQITLFHGVPVRLSDDLAVFVGFNNTLSYLSYKNEATSTDINGGRIQNTLVPNLSFRKVLGKNVEASLGASLTLLDYFRNKTTVEDATAKAETTVSQPNTLVASGGDFSVGLRWVKGTFAIEGRINESFLTNGPYLVSGASGALYAHVGMTLAF